MERDLREHDAFELGVGWAKTGERGEATARLVKDYVYSSVEVQCR